MCYRGTSRSNSFAVFHPRGMSPCHSILRIPPRRRRPSPRLKRSRVLFSLNKGRYEGEDASVYSTRRPFEPRNEFVGAQQPPLPQRTLKRSLSSKSGLNKGVRSSIFAMFRKKQTSQPDAKIRRESSVTGAILQEMEEEIEEEVASQRLLNRTEDRSRPPTLVHHQVRQTTTIRRSCVIRRSASFAGLNSQIENRNGERGSVMEAVFQLRQAWNETTDFIPDFDERSDEED
ncbi:hypothetical protein F4604DRAFT_351952 [Suillus subluteus]|nr:hypothetical protein F4604DRAFT_351952 [Suillus subluteus]